MLALPVYSQDRTQARSMVISDRGIVATSQTLASQAGAQILARGGSAMDAAIAANASGTMRVKAFSSIGRCAKTPTGHKLEAWYSPAGENPSRSSSRSAPG